MDVLLAGFGDIVLHLGTVSAVYTHSPLLPRILGAWEWSLTTSTVIAILNLGRLAMVSVQFALFLLIHFIPFKCFQATDRQLRLESIDPPNPSCQR